MPLLLCCLMQKLTTHSSLLTAHRSSLPPLPFPVLQTALRECYLIPRVQEPVAIRPSGIAFFRHHTFRTRDNHENASGRQDFPHKHEKRKRRDVCVQRPRFSLTQISPIPQRFRAIFRDPFHRICHPMELRWGFTIPFYAIRAQTLILRNSE